MKKSLGRPVHMEGGRDHRWECDGVSYSPGGGDQLRMPGDDLDLVEFGTILVGQLGIRSH